MRYPAEDVRLKSKPSLQTVVPIPIVQPAPLVSNVYADDDDEDDDDDDRQSEDNEPVSASRGESRVAGAHSPTIVFSTATGRNRNSAAECGRRLSSARFYCCQSILLLRAKHAVHTRSGKARAEHEVTRVLRRFV